MQKTSFHISILELEVETFMNNFIHAQVNFICEVIFEIYCSYHGHSDYQNDEISNLLN